MPKGRGFTPLSVIFLQSSRVHAAGRCDGAEIRLSAAFIHHLPAEQVGDLRSIGQADWRRKIIQSGMTGIKIPAVGAGLHASGQAVFRTSDQAAIL